MIIDDILQRPYWIIDVLPKQVAEDSPGQFFAVEKYFLEENRLAAVKQKHIDLVLKLNCYRSFYIYGEKEAYPSPEHIAEEMRKRYIYLVTEGSVILSEPDDLHMTVFDPDDELVDMIRTLAAGEGLYVWQP